MTGTRCPSPLLALALVLSTPVACAGEMDKYQECWKGSFTEQVSGTVRTKTSLGGPYGAFISSYDGDFRWLGEPRKTTVSLTYIYCFHARYDEGGAIVLNGNTIRMDRVGSIRLPPSVRSAMGKDFVVIKDLDSFASLYGVFESAGQGPTTLEIQLDRIRKTTTVTTRTKVGKQQSLVYMQGDAVQLHP